MGLPVTFFEKKANQRNFLEKGMEKQQYPINGGVAQLGEHLPCKQGVMGSNPIISTSRQKSAEMFIENRIKKNETKQIVVY